MASFKELTPEEQQLAVKENLKKQIDNMQLISIDWNDLDATDDPIEMITIRGRKLN
jgi:hypothetical protein